MPIEITAQQIVERVQKKLSATWKDSPLDVFCAGNPATRITGIATSFAATMDVLRRAAAAKQNLLIVREHPFFSHQNSGYNSIPRELIAKDAVCQAKQEFITKNNLVVWRFTDNWSSDGQLRGLARTLNWERYLSGGASEALFTLPETTIKTLAMQLRTRLKLSGMRLIGAPETKVRKVALSHGLILVPELRQLLQANVDAVVIGEPIEWEASPYFQDVVASGQKKGMIILGHEASADPGSGEVARWLKTFLPELPISWLPAGEPFWVPR